MNFYSQCGEDRVISELINFNDGNILDIGANDGKLLSNSLHFIEKGWGGTLIEASPVAFAKLTELHKLNTKVQCLQACLDDKKHTVTFYHNKKHISENDTDLLSTIDELTFMDSSSKNHLFEKMTLETDTYEQIKPILKYKTYDIVSIDIEGKDYEILQQINLNEIQCKFLIIEYNGNNFKKQEILNYCSNFEMNKILFDNIVNIILTKP